MADICHTLAEDPPDAAEAFWLAKLGFGAALNAVHEVKRVGMPDAAQQAAFVLSELAGDIVVTTGALARSAGRGRG